MPKPFSRNNRRAEMTGARADRTRERERESFGSSSSDDELFYTKDRSRVDNRAKRFENVYRPREYAFIPNDDNITVGRVGRVV